MLNRAQGYSFENGKLRNDNPIGADVPGAAGSLLSNAEDLVRWNTALASGKVVSKESYALMTTPVVMPEGFRGRNPRYGFGLVIDTFEDRPRIQHGGGIFGFTSMLEYLPAEGIAIAVICNCEAFNSGKVADSIAKAALNVQEFVPQDLQVSAEEAKQFVGEFKFETIPLAIVFRERGGKIYAQATGQGENRLLYQGKGVFLAEFDNAVKFTFPEVEGSKPADMFTLTQGGELVARRVGG
jgi:CubicO group peptidase (beta-lactamase class C family)